jgi:hypothetical protein
MIQNPGGLLKDCAKRLNRSENTISLIVNTDMFKTYYAERRREWQENHDFAIRDKLTRAAEGALDIMIEKMATQKAQIPMKIVTDVATSALDRLGFAPKSEPMVSVSVDNSRSQTVVIQSVSPAALEEARHALRLAEQRRSLPAPELELELAPSLVSSQGREGVGGGVGGGSEAVLVGPPEGEEE